MSTDSSSMIVDTLPKGRELISTSNGENYSDSSSKPSKRLRPEPFSSKSSSAEEGNRSRDCYQEAIWGNTVHAQEQQSPWQTARVRSSWLTNLYSIRCSEILSFPRVDQVSLKHEIEQLNQQLNQAKRRLLPAAERCTEAICNSLDNYSTTGRQEFGEARRACNPFEVLGEGQQCGLNKIFMNRSAIKLANVDAILDFSLTRFPTSGPFNSSFLFADLCAAPGGFSEYVLRRCYKSGMPACRGYGMSLMGANENGQGLTWKLQDLSGAPRYHYHVCQGVDGTGDIFRWDNVEALRKDIESDLCNAGHPCIPTNYNEAQVGEAGAEHGKVHLVLADGGFDAQRDSDCQEEITQKLVVCQVAAALSLLAKGGTLVVKMFGFQTPVIRTMMKSLFLVFDRFVVLKPISSRPASAERYVVLTGFEGATPGFYGPRWRDRVFLGHNDPMGSGALEMCDLMVRGRILEVLDCFLNEFDRDLLNLNLKACFSILSYLESKCQRISKGETDSYQWIQNRFSVDVEQYRTAWHLF